MIFFQYIVFDGRHSTQFCYRQGIQRRLLIVATNEFISNEQYFCSCNKQTSIAIEKHIFKHVLFIELHRATKKLLYFVRMLVEAKWLLKYWGLSCLKKLKWASCKQWELKNNTFCFFNQQKKSVPFNFFTWQQTFLRAAKKQRWVFQPWMEMYYILC